MINLVAYFLGARKKKQQHLTCFRESSFGRVVYTTRLRYVLPTSNETDISSIIFTTATVSSPTTFQIDKALVRLQLTFRQGSSF